MAHLIDKDAVLAEIKRRYKLVDKYETNEFCAVASRDELVHLMNFIDTLEVKDVDLEKEYDNEFFKDPVFSKLVNRNAGISVAKHFFELGLKAQKGE